MLRNAHFGVTSNVIYPQVNDTLVKINESVVKEKVPHYTLDILNLSY